MLNLVTTFGSRANAATSSYPAGSYKDDTSATVKDGTPVAASTGNDDRGFRDSLLLEAGYTANNIVDTALLSQAKDAAKEVFSRPALYHSCLEAGLNLVAGSFEDGGTLTLPKDVLWDKTDKKIYSWGGTLPKVVSSSSTPTSSGGIGAGAWVDRTNDTLRGDLQTGTGDLIRYLPATMIGAIGRPLRAKLSELVSVKDFAAVGDGVTDDTAAIQAALNTGHSILVPKGDYLISSKLTVASEGQNIYGEGATKSNILVSGSGYDAFEISANYAGVESLRIYSLAQRSSGSFVKLRSATRGNFVKNFVMQNGHVGIHIDAEAVITYIENGEILDATAGTGTGIIINGGNDTFISHVVMDSSGIEPNCGIRIDRSQAVWVSDSDIIDFGTPLRISPNGATGGLVTWCFFSQLALDTSNGNGIEVVPGNGATVKGLFFDNCWSSTNNRGVYIGSTTGGVVDTAHFTDCTFYNNQLQGALVDNANGNVRNVEFNNCRAAGNSGASTGVSAGFDIGNNVIGFAIRGCRSGAHAGFPVSQSYGFLIGTGCNQYTVTGNDVAGNAVNGALDNSRGTSTIRAVRDNLGYRTESRGVATILSGTAKTTVSHGLDGAPSMALSAAVNTNLNGMSFWTGTYTATTLNVNVNLNVPTDALIAWSASLY